MHSPTHPTQPIHGTKGSLSPSQKAKMKTLRLLFRAAAPRSLPLPRPLGLCRVGLQRAAPTTATATAAACAVRFGSSATNPSGPSPALHHQPPPYSASSAPGTTITAVTARIKATLALLARTLGTTLVAFSSRPPHPIPPIPPIFTPLNTKEIEKKRERLYALTQTLDDENAGEGGKTNEVRRTPFDCE